MEIGAKITKRLGQGEKMMGVSCSYNMNHLTTGTILKNQVKATEHVKSAANEVNSSSQITWSSDRGDGEISQQVDAGAGSAPESSPTQLNAHSRKS